MSSKVWLVRIGHKNHVTVEEPRAARTLTQKPWAASPRGRKSSFSPTRFHEDPIKLSLLEASPVSAFTLEQKGRPTLSLSVRRAAAATVIFSSAEGQTTALFRGPEPNSIPM